MGNFELLTGITYINEVRYCASTDKTIKGHMVQTRKGVRSTRPKPAAVTEPVVIMLLYADTAPPLPFKKTNDLHVYMKSISQLYTYDTTRVTIRACSGNQYVMVAYHCDSNTILVCPFKMQQDTNRLDTYSKIMLRLKAHVFNV